MKKHLQIILVILFSIVAVTLLGLAVATAEEVQPEQENAIKFVYGGRLQSDMLFYAQVGMQFDAGDLMLGVGWNDSIWIGGHAYFLNSAGISAFSGLEMHLRYPDGETIEFHPALPLGFAVHHGGTTWIVEALVLPALEGYPISAILAVSFLFSL